MHSKPPSKLKATNRILSSSTKKQKDFNEIELRRRTLDNNTHEVIEDLKLKRITSWRRSHQKFIKSLVYNILTCGILHIVSLFYPTLFVKLYCNPSVASESDYFLVENIYGKYTLCLNIIKKKYKKRSSIEQDKDNISSASEIKSEYLPRNLAYSFKYKSMVYEYNEESNEIIPVYMDLSKMTKRGIYNYFLNGLNTRMRYNQFKERYGSNEYIFDIKLLFLFFLNNEIPSYAIGIVICIIQVVVFPDYKTFLGKVGFIIAFIIIQLINIKVTIINKYKKEFTLDGEDNNIKVKRDFLLNDSNEFYKEIKPQELLPGDIIFLKANEFVPCDCLIIEGECIVNESNLTGKLNVYKKTALKDSGEYFNYKQANFNILYHGMKITKTYSKTNDNYISALCINIGPNTYKANQFSNILYFLERKKEYNYVYNLFGERKVIFFYMIICLLFTIIFAFSMYTVYKDEINIDTLQHLLLKTILTCFSECLMLPYFIAHSFMILLGIFRLQKNGIICFDKSRLINSGKINTIIFNKTGTLTNDMYEINAYHIPNFNLKKKEHIIYNSYLTSQSKEMNVILLNYYKGYLEIKEKLNNSKNKRVSLMTYNRVIENPEGYLVLFMECLLSCCNVDKFGIELFGSKIETTIFNDLKWDIKQYDSEKNDNKEKNEESEILDVKYNKSNSELNYCLLKKKITDIFPKNYYKLTESSKNTTSDKTKKKLKQISIIYDENQNSNLKKNRKSTSLDINHIISDVTKSQTNSYKLRIYKKFIDNGTFNHSAIVYNYIKEELRFMTRGYPEDIINKCAKNSLPDDIEEVISMLRKNGLIVLVCASKIIEFEEYEDIDEIDYYMEDLNFCGFVTLKNKIKDNIKFSIEQINEFNCHTVISSGDNEYNCLSAGFNSGLIENNNIYVIDKADKTNKIVFRKIYSVKTNASQNESKKANVANDKISKFTRVSKNLPKNKKKTEVNNQLDLINNIDLINSNQNESSLMRNNSLLPSKKNKNNDNTNSNIEDLSENRKLNDISNLQISDLDITKNESSNYLERAKTNKIKNDNISFIKPKRPKNNEGKPFFEFFQNIYYYHGIFEDFEELRGGIFCMSSAAFNFLYKNKSYKGIKFILEKIYSNTKIYFNMTSIDKSRLIDYFREDSNKVVCTMGECDSDLDSIISSNVGVSLKSPSNQNMILTHFFSSRKEIISLKNIITIGRLLYENSILLEIVSFSCAVTINFHVICALLKNLDIDNSVENQIKFLDIEFLILTVFSFAGSPKEKTNMIQNKKLLNVYYIVQLTALLLFKICSIILFETLYKHDTNLNVDERHYEYISFFFILTVEFIINAIFILNHISFYREPPFSNIILVVSSLAIFIYAILLICLNSSNYSSDLIGVTNFVYSENLMDTYSDQNRLWLTVTLCFDFAGSFLFCSILYIIFDCCAK